MVSDFIEERNGFLRIPEKSVRRKFEFGENRDGYWNSEKFIEHVRNAVEIAEKKYPSDQFTLLWIFDNSSNHASKGKDALIASRMNRGSGRKQPVMRDTVFNGKPFKMVLPNGEPKGLKMVLEERGVDCKGLLRKDVISILEKHSDFANEKSMIEKLLESRGHTCLFLPKFHCELNPIERVWCHAKRITREKCQYNIVALRKNIDVAFETVTVDMIRKYFRKCREIVN